MHIPVLVNEVVNFLEPLDGKMIVDATLGAGGHAHALLSRMDPKGRLAGFDQDKQALQTAKERLSPFTSQVQFFENNFDVMREVLAKAGIACVDGILMDLGLSSLQLETDERGFSFNLDGPLDMRMDRRQRLTARDLVNTLDQQKLGGLLWECGEERFSRRIAAAIVRSREESPIETTRELASIVERSIPRKAWPRHIHPATRTFQAVRIAVNHELDSLKNGLEQAVTLLATGGRLLVISYHSLEDRIAKHFFKSRDPEQWRILTKKPVVPSDEEISANPRSRSAKLRVLERAA